MILECCVMQLVHEGGISGIAHLKGRYYTDIALLKQTQLLSYSLPQMAAANMLGAIPSLYCSNFPTLVAMPLGSSEIFNKGSSSSMAMGRRHQK